MFYLKLLQWECSLPSCANYYYNHFKVIFVDGAHCCEAVVLLYWSILAHTGVNYDIKVLLCRFINIRG